MKKRVLVSLTIVVFVSVSAFGWFAYASAAENEQPTDNTIKNLRTRTVQGVAVNNGQKDGCRYVISGALAPGDMPVRSDMVIEDPSNCTAVIEEGEPVAPLGGPPQQDPVGTSETKIEKPDS